MKETEFWKLTPAQFFAMIDLVNERVKREDYRAGLLATVIRRVVGDKKAETWDFFPSLRPKNKPRRASRAEEVRRNMKQLAEIKKGKVNSG